MMEISESWTAEVVKRVRQAMAKIDANNVDDGLRILTDSERLIRVELNDSGGETRDIIRHYLFWTLLQRGTTLSEGSRFVEAKSVFEMVRIECHEIEQS